uniref:guanylate cyclase n=1 Tax=Plectus sambesii TaxID=2011161 RepID=A0A914XUU7_9BILA
LDNDINVDAGNEAFVKRISQEAGLSDAKIAVTRISNYLALYDSLSLYVRALKSAINKTGDESIYRNGRYLWNEMRLMKFDGASGAIATDALAERIPHFAGYYVHPDDSEQMLITNIRPVMDDNCDGTINGTGCYSMVLENVNDRIWSRALSGKERPRCGYDGMDCDFRPYIGAGVGVLIIFVLLVSFALYKRYQARRLLASMPWQISLDKVRLIDDSRLSKTISSLKSSHSAFSAASQFIADRSCAIFGNNYAKVQRFKQTKALNFDEGILSLLLSMKQLNHDNLIPFLGICCNNQKNEMMVLWKHCSRGTLSDYIHNDTMVMDSNFKKSFVRDITQGVEYLHTSPVGYHGSLSPVKCLIDNNFVVKVGGFALEDPIQEWTEGGSIAPQEPNKDASRS